MKKEYLFELRVEQTLNRVQFKVCTVLFCFIKRTGNEYKTTTQEVKAMTLSFGWAFAILLAIWFIGSILGKKTGGIVGTSLFSTFVLLIGF